jgi:O-antigen/teichoic acid export membrane protein
MNNWLRPIRELFVSGGSARTVKVKQNIIGLLLLRVVGIGTNLLLVPLTLTYLSPTGYGIWLTLSSILAWIGFLDIGLGNGLRNKIAEAIASSNVDRAQEYVSTTYAAVALIAGACLALFAALNPFLPWAAILNTPDSMEPELHTLALVVVGFFCFRLLFQLISSVLVAHQRPAVSSALDALVGVLSLGAVALLRWTTEGSLVLLGIAVSAISALVPLAANIWFFAGKYRGYRPTLRAVSFTHSRDLMSLGLKFFVLQLVGLALFASPNLIITQLFGPAQVTPYNIAMKYFGTATMLFRVILAPFWTAYTDAYVRADIVWIRNTLSRLRTFWVVSSAGVLLMVFAAPWVYRLWVGSEMETQIPFTLSAVVALYVIISNWVSIDVNLLSGTGRIRLQLWYSVGAALALIPLAWLLAVPVGMHVTGVVLALCLSILPACVLWPVQTGRLLSGTARGIWAE